MEIDRKNDAKFSSEFQQMSFQSMYLILRKNPKAILGGFWTFFTIVGVYKLEEYMPGYGKYISIVIGLVLGISSYIIFKRREDLTEEELLKKPIPKHLLILWWVSVVGIWAYAIFSVN